MSNFIQIDIKYFFKILFYFILFNTAFFFSAVFAQAASLSISPGTGVYGANTTFTAKVMVNTGGQSVNAAEGTLTFNPKELSVVSVNRTSSIFNLWVTEPTFSNSAGTINFSGGLPSGYSGQTGNIMSITFKAIGSGASKVNFKTGSVLANDGKGTNILTGMSGGTFTIQAQSTVPEPEKIIEYVPPANTPGAPEITSNTHPDPKKWSTQKEAILSWSLPNGVTAVRTSLDSNPTNIPTKVYDNPIKTITLSDLDEGVSYFHIQFQNADGWGKVSHYRLAIDTVKPTDLVISSASSTNPTNPSQTLKISVKDDSSKVKRFMIKVDADEAFEYIDEDEKGLINLPTLNPGYHTVMVEAFDEAGNSVMGNYSFTISSFDKPIFTDYPTEINESVIPVIKGNTRPNSKVEISVKKIGAEPNSYSITSDASGVFTFIPEGKFTNGVYELSARATDEFGAVSEMSDVVKIAVQQPGYLRIGSVIVSFLSVLIPVIALAVLLILGVIYLISYARRFKKNVNKESTEALEILSREFDSLKLMLLEQQTLLQSSRKTNKLTKAEMSVIETFDSALKNSKAKVEKEIEDITKLTETSKN